MFVSVLFSWAEIIKSIVIRLFLGWIWLHIDVLCRVVSVCRLCFSINFFHIDHRLFSAATSFYTPSNIYAAFVRTIVSDLSSIMVFMPFKPAIYLYVRRQAEKNDMRNSTQLNLNSLNKCTLLCDVLFHQFHWYSEFILNSCGHQWCFVRQSIEWMWQQKR